MKELLLDIIAKTIDYTKVFIIKLRGEAKRVKSEVQFESRKSGVIDVMYNPIFEKKNSEKNMLLQELTNIRNEAEILNIKILAFKEENMLYSKNIDALNSFQSFLLEKRN
jgi:hypothetical protein